jgi:hypothetical protein
MIKQNLLILAVTLFFGCSSNEKEQPPVEPQIMEPVPAAQHVTKNSNIEFTKYPSVSAMLEDGGDFSEEDGSLKFLSKKENHLHVQVSKPIFEGDHEKIIVEQTKRDLVYVAFQAFAQTDINELTITSVPMMQETKDYVNKYKLERKTNRNNAKKIMMKYLGTEDFKVLFELNGTVWVPSEKFNQLKFKNLEPVFKEL